MSESLVVPPPNRWEFPPASTADEYGIVAVGADLEPGTVLAAYQQGIFPMPMESDALIGWWSPDPRGILDLDALRVSRSLRRSCRRYSVTCNQTFDAVVEGCADPARDGGWINDAIASAYGRLHRMGWAHSVEVWDGPTLVGGLYGLAIGGVFFGESMFHRSTDASKVALVHLVERLRLQGASFIDVQWETDHLRTLGVRSIDRATYLVRLRAALAEPHTARLH